MKKSVFLFLFLALLSELRSQELYIFNDPASNVPAKSLTTKYGGKWMREKHLSHIYTTNRQMLESQFGISNKLMLKTGITFSDMYSNRVMKFESASLYAKYRFLSMDQVHRHLRAAVFMKGVLSTNPLRYDEITSDGDQTGMQSGVIVTQLVNKLAVSATLATTQVLDKERWLKYTGPRQFGYRSFNYALSAGYLVLPRSYSSYKQTNFNLYLEMIGSRGDGPQYVAYGGGGGMVNLYYENEKFHFLDLAPAMQLIFNSSSKLNIGYRFQVSGNAYRMAQSALFVSFEHTFLNALRKK